MQKHLFVKIVLCDPPAFEPFKRLIEGPLDAKDLPLVERFVRAIVLHDQARLMPDITHTGDGINSTILLTPPELDGYGLLPSYPEQSVSRVQLDKTLADGPA